MTDRPAVVMGPAAMARHLPLPAGIDRETGALLSLLECLTTPSRVADPATLSFDARFALVKARWKAGEWHDVHVMPGGFVNLDRALREIDTRTELGLRLLQKGMNALALAHRHAGPVGDNT